MYPFLSLILALGDLPVRPVAVPQAAITKPISIECPLGQLTRLVFPERLVMVKASSGAAEALGVTPEESRPLGVVVIRPSKIAKGTVELRGPVHVLVLVIQSVEKGAPSEIRLTIEAAPPSSVAQQSAQPKAERSAPPDRAPSGDTDTPAQITVPLASPPAIAPPPSLAPSPEPTTAPSIAPSVVPSAPARAAFDTAGFEAANATPIGRREGLPGEAEMVLDAAFRGQAVVWLRFRLEGGAAARVKRVSWNDGEVAAVKTAVVGRDLHIIVQLPKEKVSSKTRVVVEIASGGTYRFALNSGTFTDSLKGIFQ